MNTDKVGSNRSFGIVFSFFFLLIAIYPLINQDSIKIWSVILSVIFLALGLINARVLTPLNILWFKFGMLLGKFISPLVMGMVFFLVVTPTGIIMRLLNKNLLNLEKNKSNSYWIKKQENKSDMTKQF